MLADKGQQSLENSYITLGDNAGRTFDGSLSEKAQRKQAVRTSERWLKEGASEQELGKKGTKNNAERGGKLKESTEKAQ